MNNDKKNDNKGPILNRTLEVLYYQIKQEEFNSITNEQLNISSKEWNYLVWFHRYPTLSITKIGKKFLISKATLSIGLKNLISNGLIKKNPGKDARFLKLKVTEKGKKYIAIHDNIQDTIKADLLKYISEEDYEQLITIGDKLLANKK